MSELDEYAPACSECDGVGKGATGREIYPHRPDLYAKHFYRCDCGAYVGCHPGTVKALGSPAGAETRRARSAAHAAFDPIWKRGKMRRGDAYRALAKALGIHPKGCHISWFRADMCARVVDVAPTLATPDGAERVHEQVSQPIRDEQKTCISATIEAGGRETDATNPALGGARA